MAGSGSSMLYSLLLFVATLSLQEMFRAKLASSELFTIVGGFTSSLIFLMLLTFIGNYQESIGVRTGWGAGRTFCSGVLDGLCGQKNLLISGILTYVGSLTLISVHSSVIIAEAVALIAASTVHRVSITTCFLFSAGLLYEVNKFSGMIESKGKRF